MVRRKLNTGALMPVTGFGTWQIAGGQETVNTLSHAIKCGYRLIDTATLYKNEASVGRAVNQSGIGRRDFFITTKLWKGDMGYDSAVKAFDKSLELLDQEYIDLYLIHWPGEDPALRQESWKALEDIYASGRSKAIGVSNYGVKELKEMKRYAKITPAVNQIELNPFNYLYQRDVLDYCTKAGIAVEAYSPLARARDLDDKTIQAVAKKHSKSAAQVMIRWAIQIGTTPIPKSVHPERIEENIDVFDFVLAPDEINTIAGVGR